MWRVGILGALVMSITFIGAVISIIFNEGLGAFSSAKELVALVMVFFTVVFLLIIAWGRIRLLLGRKQAEITFPNYASRLVFLLNALGVISLILIPLIALGLFAGAYDKP